MAMIGGTNEADQGMDFGGVSGGGFTGPGEIGGIGTGSNFGPGGYSPEGLDSYGGGGSIGDWLGGLWDNVDNALTGGFDWGNAAKWGGRSLATGSMINPGVGLIGGMFGGILGGLLGEGKNKYNQDAAPRGIVSSPQGSPGSNEEREPYNYGVIDNLAQQSFGFMGGASAPVARGKKPGKPSGLYGSEEVPGSIRRYLKSSEDDDLAENLAFGKDEFTKRLF